MTKDQIKEKIIQILNRDMSSSQDNLYRIKRAFGGLSEEYSNQQYGQSGQTPKEIIAGYKRVVDETNECINWINAQL